MRSTMRLIVLCLPYVSGGKCWANHDLGQSEVQLIGMRQMRSVNGVTVVTAQQATLRSMLSEFFAHGELLYFLVKRTYKIRYAQAAFGLAWAILQPLLSALIMAVVMGRYMRPSTEGVPVFLFFFAGTVPWSFFANALSSSAISLSSNQALVQKVYFPRLCLPVAAVISAAFDLIVPLIILFCVLFATGWLRLTIMTLPFVFGLLCIEFATAVGIGAGLAALNLKYRDVQHALPFATQILFFISPILYSGRSFPGQWQFVYYMNPLAGVFETIRSELLHTAPVPWEHLILSTASAALFFVGGLYYFLKAEGRFADIA